MHTGIVLLFIRYNLLRASMGTGVVYVVRPLQAANRVCGL